MNEVERSTQREQPSVEFISKVELVSDRHVEGHVLDPADLDRRFVVELIVDGYPSRIARANIHDPGLKAAGHGDGCYRFYFGLDREAAAGARSIEVRIANTLEPVGQPVRLPRERPKRDAEPARSRVEWRGGLRLSGWIAKSGSGRSPIIRVIIDGAVAAQEIAALWTVAGEGDAAAAVPAFDLHIPAQFADGRFRQVRIVDEQGADLEGSPCGVLAYRDGLERFIAAQADLDSERVRGRLYDQLLPQSLPMREFAAWSQIYPPDAPRLAKPPKVAVAFVGASGGDSAVGALAAQDPCEWVATELSDKNGDLSFHARELADFLNGPAADHDFVLFAPGGTMFHPFALGRLAEALTVFPRSHLAYGDLIMSDAAGKDWPLALTAFDYERMLEQGSCALVFMCRAEHARRAAEAGVDDAFRMFNHALGREGPLSNAAPAHTPGFLARIPPIDLPKLSAKLALASREHLAQRKQKAEVHAGVGRVFPAARVERPLPPGKISILIPTRDRLDLLKPCLESLSRTVLGVKVEIIVLDNDSSDVETLQYLDEIARRGVRVARVRGSFNFARIVNAGAAIATGEYLLLLNNDVEARHAGWLEEMLSRLAEPDVGAVGALLVWPSGVVQHGGVVVGLNFAAGHVFNERMEEDAGYADLMTVAHEGSAVTAACLLTHRALFRELGGFDGARYPVNFNDVDFCLRLRARGLRIVLTPHARLLHRESASRGRDLAPDAANRHERELHNLRLHWGAAMENEPFYNPLLALDGTPYSSLAWPPRSQAPRLATAAKYSPAPSGF